MVHRPLHVSLAQHRRQHPGGRHDGRGPRLARMRRVVVDVPVALRHRHLADEIPFTPRRHLHRTAVGVRHDDVARALADQKHLAADLPLPHDVIAGAKLPDVQFQRVGEVVEPQPRLAKVAGRAVEVRREPGVTECVRGGETRERVDVQQTP